MKLRRIKKAKKEKPIFSEREKKEFFESFACKKLLEIANKDKIRNSLVHEQVEKNVFELFNIMKYGRRNEK